MRHLLSIADLTKVQAVAVLDLQCIWPRPAIHR